MVGRSWCGKGSSGGLVVACLLLTIAAAWVIDYYAMDLRWPWHAKKRGKVARSMEEVEQSFLRAASNETIAAHLYHLTREPHVAGTPENSRTADYVLSAFNRSGFKTHHRDYQVLLSYPRWRSLVLITTALGEDSTLRLGLEEEAFDEFSSNPVIIPPFHAFAPSGSAIADVTYVNYGRLEDYAVLRELGVEVKGSIVLARYGKLFRGDIVANAEKQGALAAIIYSDPMEYASNGTQGYYPDSQWLPLSGVQRGTVQLGVGDPLTPGWPSTLDAERLAVDDSRVKLPSIPSLPISAQDALLIMKALGGSVAPPSWHGSLDVNMYHVGSGPARLNLSYIAGQDIKIIRNVFGVVEGYEEPDRYVLLGNHRDAWTFGAADPNSGTAALLEIAERLGDLLKKGWQPRRTIVLCSWDAEEYGLIGSTEWVEENVKLLSSRAIAYLNVDVAVAADGFFASATPQLDGLLKLITKKVRHPGHDNASIYDMWVESSNANSSLIDRLSGTDSDYAPFLHYTGVPSLDIHFGNDYPVYHSSYDNYKWMEMFGDPSFQRHTAVANIWGLLTLKLVSEPLLPFDYEHYSEELKEYAKAVDKQLHLEKAPSYVTSAPLYRALDELSTRAQHIREEMRVSESLESQEEQPLYLHIVRRNINERLLLAERALLDSDGLPFHPCSKHLVYGSRRYTEYGFAVFPGISDALAVVSGLNDTKSWSSVQHEIWRVARAITNMGLVLQNELT